MPRRRKDGITVRGDTGRPQIDIWVRLPDGRRKRIRRAPTATTPKGQKEEAARLQTRFIDAAIHGEPRGGRSFAEAVIAYLDFEERGTGDVERLKRISAALGDIKLRDINQERLAELRKALLRPGHKVSTFNRGIITPVRAVMMFAADQDWCDRPRFKTPKRDKTRTEIIYPSEMRKILLAAAPHAKPIFTFIIGTGARCSEVMDLDWRQVDLAAARATLDTKTGLYRHAYLPPVVVSALAALPHREGKVFYWQTVTPKRVGKNPPKIVQYADRGRQEGGHLRTAWKGALRRAGFGDRPWKGVHTLRHSWASWHYAVHKDLLKLKQDGLWASVTMVERYAHVMQSGHEQEILDFWNGKSHVLDTAEGKSAAGH